MIWFLFIVVAIVGLVILDEERYRVVDEWNHDSGVSLIVKAF